MPTPHKAATIDELEDRVSRASVAISAGYRGLKVAEMTTLRRRMRDAGTEVHVVKNTLLRIAAERAGKPELFQIATGPTAIIFGFDDPTAAAKAVTDYVRTARNALTIQGVYMDGQVFAGDQVGEIASLPSRDTLIAQFVGGMQSPIATFAGLLTSVVREFAGLVDARVQQLEGTAPA